MSFITNAIGSILGSLTGANQQAQAATTAAQTEANAANYAANLQQQQFNTTQANLSPYMSLGTSALPTLMGLLGTGGGGTAGINATLSNLPGYQFTLQQGLNAVNNATSATGQNASGAQAKGLANYATKLAQSNYQNYLNNYLQTVGMGQNAAAELGGLGSTTASNIGNLLTSGASATAAGQVAQGNVTSNALSSLLGLGTGAAGIYSLASGGQAGQLASALQALQGGGSASAGISGLSSLTPMAPVDYSLSSAPAALGIL